MSCTGYLHVAQSIWTLFTLVFCNLNKLPVPKYLRYSYTMAVHLAPALSHCHVTCQFTVVTAGGSTIAPRGCGGGVRGEGLGGGAVGEGLGGRGWGQD